MPARNGNSKHLLTPNQPELWHQAPPYEPIPWQQQDTKSPKPWHQGPPKDPSITRTKAKPQTCPRGLNEVSEIIWNSIRTCSETTNEDSKHVPINRGNEST